jgi:hypothetical protein
MGSPERYLDVPFLPGESPVHCKGVLYVDSIAYYNEHVPGGWAGLTERIREPRLKAYLSQRFLAGTWYDVFPIVAAHRMTSISAGTPYLDFAVIKALEIAGVRNIQHRWMATEPDGEAHGLPLVRVRREVRWES